QTLGPRQPKEQGFSRPGDASAGRRKFSDFDNRQPLERMPFREAPSEPGILASPRIEIGRIGFITSPMSEPVELSRRFLSDTGGWKEMKEARAIHAAGRASQASYRN